MSLSLESPINLILPTPLLVSIVQGAKTLTKEDIESVFSLYDRVSRVASLPYHSRMSSTKGWKVHFRASISTPISSTWRRTSRRRSFVNDDGWCQGHRRLNWVEFDALIDGTHRTGAEGKLFSVNAIKICFFLARTEMNAETISVANGK